MRDIFMTFQKHLATILPIFNCRDNLENENTFSNVFSKGYFAISRYVFYKYIYTILKFLFEI